MEQIKSEFPQPSPDQDIFVTEYVVIANDFFKWTRWKP